MKYVMLVCVDDSAGLTLDAMSRDAEMQAATEAWVKEMDSRGVRLRGNRLRPISDATTVRVRGDEVLLSDGPFAETKEYIAGFDIIECADLDEAIEVAGKHPVARFGSIELRPFWED
jgi:hypothetical protein